MIRGSRPPACHQLLFDVGRGIFPDDAHVMLVGLWMVALAQEPIIVCTVLT